MSSFETYLKKLADHEEKRNKMNLSVREKVLVNAGINLNWLGDLLAHPKATYRKKQISLDQIILTGINPVSNKILIDRCKRSVALLRDYLATHPKVKKRFEREASYGKEPILLRGPENDGYYWVVDGMHRVIGAVLRGDTKIAAFVPATPRKPILPICEAHVVYDLIRGYQRNARNVQGKKDLFHALRLLSNTYSNVCSLLTKRFDEKHVPGDPDVQDVIKRVIS